MVVTAFNRDYPLIRFGPAISRLCCQAPPCGRTALRIKGWMGRADQTTKIKGMFRHPKQIADVVKRHPQLGRVRLVVDNASGQDRMTPNCEAAGDPTLVKRSSPACATSPNYAAKYSSAAPASCPTTEK